MCISCTEVFYTKNYCVSETSPSSLRHKEKGNIPFETRCLQTILDGVTNHQTAIWWKPAVKAWEPIILGIRFIVLLI
jgi:hypothetical protein